MAGIMIDVDGARLRDRLEERRTLVIGAAVGVLAVVVLVVAWCTFRRGSEPAIVDHPVH